MLEFAQEEEPSGLLYRLLDSTLEALLAGVDRDLASRYFEAWVLRLTGVFPPPRECPACRRPFPPSGAVMTASGEGLICPDCAGSAARAPGTLAAGPEVLDFLLRIGSTSLPALAASPPSPATLRRIEQLCARVRRHFLQHELRSYEVIQRTLAGV